LKSTGNQHDCYGYVLASDAADHNERGVVNQPCNLRDRWDTLVAMRQPSTGEAGQVTVSDRQRLDSALMELISRGYTVPFKPWEVDCRSCGWVKYKGMLGLGAEDPIPPGQRVIWWHDQSDVTAFCGADEMPHTPEFIQSMPEDAEEFHFWIEAHADEAEADTAVARSTLFTRLRAMLPIHWIGNSEEITAALRAQGLRVHSPGDEESCIAVLAEQADLAAVAIGEDVGIQVGELRTVISARDARRLVRKINAAARAAESVGLPSFN
jgi:hypothetical protein